MVAKALNLLFVGFILVQITLSCPYEENISLKDKNTDGYLNKPEACELKIEPRNSRNAEIDQCFEQFHSMDLNNDELISCQEITVAILIAEYLKNQVDQLGADIRQLYSQKPENCKKIFAREMKPVLESFESPKRNLTKSEIQEFMMDADFNADERVSCEGNWIP